MVTGVSLLGIIATALIGDGLYVPRRYAGIDGQSCRRCAGSGCGKVIWAD